MQGDPTTRAGQEKLWSFAAPTVDRLEVSAGMKGGNKGPMTKWGLIGTGAGAIDGTDEQRTPAEQCRTCTLFGAAGLTIHPRARSFARYNVGGENWSPERRPIAGPVHTAERGAVRAARVRAWTVATGRTCRIPSP